MKPIAIVGLGGLSGTVSAAAIRLMPLGDMPGIRLGAHCLGFHGIGDSCGGAPGELCLWPGLVFGVLFSLFLRRNPPIGPWRAAAFGTAATAANALAVTVAAAIVDPIGNLLGDAVPVSVPIALAGAIAGTVGGGGLAGVAAMLIGGGWIRGTAVGAGLGLLLPVLFEIEGAGPFLFYIVWQAGYALALPGLKARPAR